VLEAAAAGQLESCCGAILLFLSSSYIDPPSGAVGMWKSGALVFAGFPSPVGKRGKLVFAF
jgi:hypothetical protein